MSSELLKMVKKKLFNRSIMKTMPRYALILAGLLFALPLPSYAIDPAEPPSQRSSEQASVIDQKIRDEMESLEPVIVTVPEPEVEPTPKPAAGDVTFFVKEIRLEGNRVISTSELKPLLSSYENREITMKELSQAAEAVEKTYRKQGYITSRAIIPPQKLDTQSPLIRVIESKVGNIEIEGERFTREKYLASHMKLKKGERLNYAPIREALVAMNQNPDRQVKSVFRKGTDPESTDIILKVDERLPYHAGLSYDNQGSPATGRQRFGPSVRTTNLTGTDDALSVGSVFGENFGTLFNQYLRVIPQTGTRLGFLFSHAQVDPQKDSKAFAVNGISQTYSPSLSQNVVKKEWMNASFGTRFDFKESRTKILSGTFRRERLRVLRFGPDITIKDRFGITSFSPEFSFGMNAMGASIYATSTSSRLGIEPGFFHMDNTFSRIQKMPWETRLLTRGEGQFATHKLPSSEALYLGGANSIRGYPEGDYLADSGIYFSNEHLIPLSFIPKEVHLPFFNTPVQKQFEFLSFLDFGYGRLRGPASTDRKDRYLLGAGVGIKIRITDYLFGRLEVGHALGQEPLTESDHTRFHFRIQTEI
jgi:hemolysin activation/secretion protein